MTTETDTTSANEPTFGRCSFTDERGRQCTTNTRESKGRGRHRHSYAPTLAEVLQLEREYTRHNGVKQKVIADRFGISPAKYYQYLEQMITTEEALAADPILVAWIQRRTTARLAGRASRTFTRPTHH